MFVEDNVKDINVNELDVLEYERYKELICDI